MGRSFIKKIGDKYKAIHGYVLVYFPEHPKSHNGYIYQHIMVVEKLLGRYLYPEERVHHIDGDRGNNKKSNLLLCSCDSQHKRIHHGWKMRDNKWFKKCFGCKKLLEVENNFHKRGNKNKTPINLCKKCSNLKSKLWKREKRKKLINN
jgi:hypothetical protein